jgi:hypothetical protein
VWFFAVPILRACVTGVIGSSFGKWFATTKAGIWFQKKLDNFMEYLSYKYDIDIAKKEAKWVKHYPKLAIKIEELENRISELENANIQRVAGRRKTKTRS